MDKTIIKIQEKKVVISKWKYASTIFVMETILITNPIPIHFENAFLLELDHER